LKTAYFDELKQCKCCHNFLIIYFFLTCDHFLLILYLLLRYKLAVKESKKIYIFSTSEI